MDHIMERTLKILNTNRLFYKGDWDKRSVCNMLHRDGVQVSTSIVPFKERRKKPYYLSLPTRKASAASWGKMILVCHSQRLLWTTCMHAPVVSCLWVNMWLSRMILCHYPSDLFGCLKVSSSTILPWQAWWTHFLADLLWGDPAHINQP